MYTSEEIRIGNDRLRKAALAVEEHPNPAKFTMRETVLECGTPGCVMGAYAARGDLQQTFHIKRGEFGSLLVFCGVDATDSTDFASFEDIAPHFAITVLQADSLFGRRGCDNAKTPAEAAAYIRYFVALRAAALPRPEAAVEIEEFA